MLCIILIGIILSVLVLFVLTVAVMAVLIIAHVRSKSYGAKGVLENPMYLKNTDENIGSATFNCSTANVNIVDKSNDSRPKLATPTNPNKIEIAGIRPLHEE